MNDKEFREFKRKSFCTDADLMKLTEKQMYEVANTDARVSSWGTDLKRKAAKARNLRQPATKRYWKPEDDEDPVEQA